MVRGEKSIKSKCEVAGGDRGGGVVEGEDGKRGTAEKNFPRILAESKSQFSESGEDGSLMEGRGARGLSFVRV